ncbi:hypothetical protein MPSEU_000653000 [Mayamaea pseudoterrestris]|nr:hypothetical protein MPSEU_000653000 [Mayamaea pseudoterrestris]
MKDAFYWYKYKFIAAASAASACRVEEAPKTRSGIQDTGPTRLFRPSVKFTSTCLSFLVVAAAINSKSAETFIAAKNHLYGLMESETFFLPGFILDDDSEAMDPLSPQRQDRPHQATEDSGAAPFATSPFTISQSKNPWEEGMTSVDASTSVSASVGKCLLSLEPDNIDALLQAPEDITAASLNGPTCTAKDSFISRQTTIEGVHAPRLSLERATSSDYAFFNSNMDIPKAPPGFENVAPLSLPTTPQSRHVQIVTETKSADIWSNESSDMHLASNSLRLPSMFDDGAAKQLLIRRGISITPVSKGDHPTEPNQPSLTNTLSLNCKQEEEQQQNSAKSWVSVVSLEGSNSASANRAFANKELRRAQTLSNGVAGDTKALALQYDESDPSIRSTAALPLLNETLPTDTTNQRETTGHRTCTFEGAAGVTSTRPGDACGDSGRAGRLGFSMEATATMASDSEHRFLQPPPQIERKISVKATKKTKQQSRTKRYDHQTGSSHRQTTSDTSAYMEECTLAGQPHAQRADQQRLNMERVGPDILIDPFARGIGNLISIGNHIGNVFVNVIWPVIACFGKLFAFLANTIIIIALMLANAFKYAAAEVEQSEHGTFICYLTFYVLPNVCDVIMTLFSVPHFTPHVLSSLALYLLCHPGRDGATWSAGVGSKRKIYRSKTPTDQQAEIVCCFVLQICRYTVPFELILNGFSHPNVQLMMMDVPCRLLLAYILSLLRSNLLLSPVAWVCCAVQVILSVQLPCNKGTDCLLMLIGLASIRLSSLVVQTVASALA